MHTLHKIFKLAAPLAFSCWSLPAFAAPLPTGTLLTIEPGVSGTTSSACVSGSCFTFSISGVIRPISYYTLQPGSDGGIVIGKNQAAGISPDAGELAGFINVDGLYPPGSMYTTPYAYDPTSDASGNVFDERSCLSSDACVGKTMLGTWNMAGSPGRGAAMGTASNQCNIFPSAYCPGVTKWEISPAGAPGIDGDRYVLEYKRVFPDYLDGVYAHNFSFHLEGTIQLPKSAGVDLAVTMAGAPNPTMQNQPVTYTATVYNIGTKTASGVIFNDSLPVDANLLSVTASQGSCSGSAVITCALGDIASGASVSVAISVEPTVSGTLVNSVDVGSIEADANPADNSASSSLVVTPPPPTADVVVTMSANAATVKRLTDLSYNINVVNAGPDTARSTLAYSILPSAMKLASVTSSQGTCSSAPYFVGFSLTTLVYCSFGDMASQDHASMTVLVQPSRRGTFTTIVNVQSATTDNNTGNNTAKVTTKVN